MSKITPKNLQYNNAPPPFLARLQANNASRDGRHEIQAVRAQKPRSAADVADDEPVYFDEGTGESLTKGEWEEREAAAAEGDTAEGASTEGKAEKEGEDKNEEEARRLKQNIATVGVSRKRKTGKVVGGEEEEPTAARDADAIEQASKPGKKQDKGKTAKKSKKIKLSFGDDE